MARASLCSSKCGKLSPFLSTMGSWRITFKTHQVTWTHVDAYGACEFMNWKCVCVHAGVLSVSAEIGTPPIRRRVSILFTCITRRHLAAGSGTSNSDSQWSTFSKSSAHSYLAPFLEMDDRIFKFWEFCENLKEFSDVPPFWVILYFAKCFISNNLLSWTPTADCFLAGNSRKPTRLFLPGSHPDNPWWYIFNW